MDNTVKVSCFVMLLMALLVLLMTLMSGCESVESEMSDYQGHSMFFKPLSQEECGEIVYDTRTGVKYWRAKDSFKGSLTLLVDKDGKPLIYKGGEE